jgi:peroxiredoxin
MARGVSATADHSAAELLIMAGPSCSNSHIPGFINHKKLKNAGDVFVVAVNDPFV